MSVKYERTEFLAYAICQIACPTNEDRFYANMTHAMHGVESVASFGVFDGHLGSGASETLAGQNGMHAKVAKTYRNLIRPDSSHRGSYKVKEIIEYVPAAAKKGVTDNEELKSIAQSSLSAGVVIEKSEGRCVDVPAIAATKNGIDSTEGPSLASTADTAPSASLSEEASLARPAEGSDPSEVTLQLSIDACDVSTLNNNVGEDKSEDGSELSQEEEDFIIEKTVEEMGQKEKDLLAQTVPQLLELTKRDALMCEAINQGAAQLDKELKSITSSGSTAVSLFLQWGNEAVDASGIVHKERQVVSDTGPMLAGKTNAPVRVYCANAGDSRCVMLRCNASPLGEPFGVAAFDALGKASKLALEQKKAQEEAERAAAAAPAEAADAAPVDNTTADTTATPAAAAVPPKRVRPPRPFAFRPEPPLRDKHNNHKFTVAHLMTEDHKLGLYRERQRIISRTDAKFRILPADASPPYLPERLRPMPPSRRQSSVIILSPPKSALMSKEHANRMKVLSANEPSAHGHVAASSVHNAKPIAMSEGGSIFDWNYPTQLFELAASLYISSVKNSIDPTKISDINMLKTLLAIQRNPPVKTPKGASSKSNKLSLAPPPVSTPAAVVVMDAFDIRVPLNDNGSSVSRTNSNAPGRYNHEAALKEAERWVTEGIEPPIVYEESFVKPRTVKLDDGRTVSGPEALYSRHNISIMMTRSMGDKFGPRACVAIPEISACTIPSASHARFVLATDGVWDVVSIEDIRRIGLNLKYQDPRVLASHIANKSVRRRERGQMRMDDITVIVVDVNPNSYLNVEGSSGGEGEDGTGCACTVA